MFDRFYVKFESIVSLTSIETISLAWNMFNIFKKLESNYDALTPFGDRWTCQEQKKSCVIPILSDHDAGSTVIFPLQRSPSTDRQRRRHLTFPKWPTSLTNGSRHQPATPVRCIDRWWLTLKLEKSHCFGLVLSEQTYLLTQGLSY